jgi:ketosteroid isomerase-like protein
VPARDVSQLLRLAFDAWNRRDIDSLLAICDPAIEVRSLMTEAERPTYHGHQGVRDWLAAVVEVFPDWHPRPQGTAGPGDVAIVPFEVHATATGSRVPIHQAYWLAAHASRDGRLAYYGFFRTEADARAKADLNVVGAIWAAFADLRFPAEHFDDDVEWHVASDELEAGTYRGHDGARRVIATAFDSLERPEIELSEIVPAGDRVLVTFHAGGRGRTTGVRVWMERTHAYRLAGGRVVEVREYPSEEEARAALRLGGRPSS